MYALSDSYCQRTNSSKPDLPYIVGRHLSLRSHQPPAPTSNAVINFETARERESVHPVARCLRNPPLPGNDGQITAEVQIVRTIRAEDKHSAQVVTVRVKPSTSHKLPTDTDLVAKIYDPLYFDHDQDDADPFLHVDKAYSHETAAYKTLSALQGGTIPKYFGSFTIKRPVNKTMRFVRLILVEFIPGRTMRQLTATNLSQPVRKNIMKAVIDAESLIYTHNIFHMDVRPSNILVCNNGTELRRVVIIDFGRCYIGRIPIPHLQQRYLPGVPISPLLRWKEPRGPFESWIDWSWRPWLEHVYESTKPSITEYMRSVWTPQLPPPLSEPPLT